MTTNTNFKEAMARFPSGVVIATTTDHTGRWWGFTASSFCSVSMEPPLVLVCLAKTAECQPTFATVDRWNIHIIHPEHANLATKFATRGSDKFAGDEFRPDLHGLPQLDQACVTLHCRAHNVHDAGDHIILVGHVDETELSDAAPALYYQRAFHPTPVTA
jgi:flavin reductase ActVB